MNKKILLIPILIIFAQAFIFAFINLSDKSDALANERKIYESADPENNYKNLFSDSFIFFGDKEINNISLTLNSSSIKEDEDLFIDIKEEKNNNKYYFEITNLENSEKLYFETDSLPAKIKPLSFNPGNYQINLRFNNDGKYYQAEDKINVISSDKNPICNQDIGQCRLNNVYYYFDKSDYSYNFLDYGRYLVLLTDKYQEEIYNLLHQYPGVFTNIVIANNFSADSTSTISKIYTGGKVEKTIMLSKNEYLYSDLSGFKKFYYTEAKAGVIIHELAHYLKTPKNSEIIPELSWINEGISDYTRDKLGFSSNVSGQYPHCENGKSYLDGYECAADFFVFIENKYHKSIPKQFVSQLEIGIGTDYNSFTKALFNDYIGKDVETLWNEYNLNK